MSRSARTLFVFGIYLLLLGPVLILVPNALLSVFGVPPTDEVWIRVVGVLAMVIGFYDLAAAKHELIDYFRATVPVRLMVLLAFALFVILDMVHPALLIFGFIDGAGAVWTALSLRAEKQIPAATGEGRS
ncbi:hypothetical protein ACFL6R_04360 [Gemmatimonadota bacterium]